jgi:hemerythrin
MKYEFTEDFLTGIEFIDKQHARLFELANQTYDLLNDQLVTDKYDRIVDVLSELRDYTKTHFADEEAFMKAIGFQYIWSEKHAHLTFIAKLDAIDLDKIDENQQAHIIEILDFLAKWLTFHIKGADARIGDWVKGLQGDAKTTAGKHAAEMMEKIEQAAE